MLRKHRSMWNTLEPDPLSLKVCCLETKRVREEGGGGSGQVPSHCSIPVNEA